MVDVPVQKERGVKGTESRWDGLSIFPKKTNLDVGDWPWNKGCPIVDKFLGAPLQHDPWKYMYIKIAHLEIYIYIKILLNNICVFGSGG